MLKSVATDMQHHMFSLNTIKCTVSICEYIYIYIYKDKLHNWSVIYSNRNSNVVAVGNLCRTSSSDISGYHADFHEGHGAVGEWRVYSMACVN
jgi:hypothetical protein